MHGILVGQGFEDRSPCACQRVMILPRFVKESPVATWKCEKCGFTKEGRCKPRKCEKCAAADSFAKQA